MAELDLDASDLFLSVSTIIPMLMNFPKNKARWACFSVFENVDCVTSVKQELT